MQRSGLWHLVWVPAASGVLPGIGGSDRLFEALWLRLRAVLSRSCSLAPNSARNKGARMLETSLDIHWSQGRFRRVSPGFWHAAEWTCGTHVVRVTLWRGWVGMETILQCYVARVFYGAVSPCSFSQGRKVESLAR